MPARSWPLASSGPCVSVSCSTNVSGRAPNFSALARLVDEDWVNGFVWLPVMIAWPPRIGSWLVGAESTEPSRTIAICWPALGLLVFEMAVLVVASPNCLVPSELNDKRDRVGDLALGDSRCRVR